MHFGKRLKGGNTPPSAHRADVPALRGACPLPLRVPRRQESGSRFDRIDPPVERQPGGRGGWHHHPSIPSTAVLCGR